MHCVKQCSSKEGPGACSPRKFLIIHPISCNLVQSGSKIDVTCVSVCLSVKSHLTLEASLHPENAAMCSAGNKGQKNMWCFL